jgi:ComEC/Rec2-related protein
MIYKLIIIYLIGILFQIFLDPNLIFLILSFIMSFIIYILCKHLVNPEQNIKDIIFNTKFYVSFIIYSIVFLISTTYTDQEIESVSYKHFPAGLLNIEGTIVDMKHKNKQVELTFKVNNLSDTNGKRIENRHPDYLKVSVSPYNHFELYDRVSILGEVKLNNYQTYYNNRPLFFNYEYEQIFYNTPYNVSGLKNITAVTHDKSVFEKLKIFFYKLSETLKSSLSKHMQEPYAQVAEGISLGNQENISKDIKDIFRTSGLIHILVLSGANVSFVISIIWYLLRNQKNKSKVYLAIIISWTFIFVTGLTAPSVRAGVMSSTNILSEYFSKNVTTFKSLLISLFILTILNPLTLIYSPSLHLSFLACFGIFLIAPKAEKILACKFQFFKKNHFTNFILSTFLGIFLTTTPYILALTENTSLFGTVLTFLVEPFVMMTTILSFLIILVSFASDFLADLLGVVNSLSVKFILLVAKFGAQYLPTLNLHISVTALIIYYISLILIYNKIDKYKIYEK